MNGREHVNGSRKWVNSLLFVNQIIQNWFFCNAAIDNAHADEVFTYTRLNRYELKIKI